ncbi:hypothetical protein BH10BAC5_BH10BAC5_10030 [soil metagenome]
MNSDNYLDNIIESELKKAMKPVSPSNSFNSDLMKRISLQKEFEMEDIKGDKLAKTILRSIVGAFLTLAGIIIYFILKTPASTTSDTAVLERTSSFLEIFSMRLLSVIGLESTGSIILALVSIGIIFILYNRMDKLIFRKK